MKRTTLICAVLLAACSAEFSPTGDSNLDRGYYVPKDLEDSLLELDRSLSWATKRRLKALPESRLAGATHMELGLFIRNYWLRPSTSRLRASMEGLGVRALDDMSSIIIVSFHRRLNGRELDVQQQIAYYDAYWEAVQPPPPHICKGTSTAMRIKYFDYSRSTQSEGPRIVHVGVCPDGSQLYFEHGRGWSEVNPLP